MSDTTEEGNVIDDLRQGRHEARLRSRGEEAGLRQRPQPSIHGARVVSDGGGVEPRLVERRFRWCCPLEVSFFSI